MTRESFDRVHPWVLAHEGGYVDDPRDPGGATNFGVTQATYDAYRKRIGQTRRPVRKIQAVERDTIYRLQYWNKIMGDDLPAGVDYAVYDFAVNSGPSRAAKYLQRVVGVKQDGIIGLQTLAAVSRMNATEVIAQLCAARMAFLRRLRHWPTFKNGWTRRVVGKWEGVQQGDHGVLDRATLMVGRTVDIPSPKVIKDGSGQRAPEPTGWSAFFAAILSLFRK